MSARQDGLGCSALSLEGLEDDANLVSHFGIFVDFSLKSLKDLGVYHGCHDCDDA